MSVIKVITVKRGTFRGEVEEWSNGYHFSGTAPADRAAASALFKAVFALEAPFITAGQKLVQGYYYENPDGNATIGTDYRADTTTDLNSTGTAFASGNALSLEQVSLMKARCGYTSKGRPRYVMKFFHGVKRSGSDPDKVDWSTTAPLPATLAAKYTDGSLPGGLKLCRPDGMVCEAPTLDPYVRTRTLKRRGKRPSS
jgi:hypothetical protein